MLTLADILAGQTVRVLEIHGDDSLSARIMEMGIIQGEVVRVIALAPLGDPMELEVQRYRLSLRKAEARRISVSIDSDSK